MHTHTYMHTYIHIMTRVKYAVAVHINVWITNIRMNMSNQPMKLMMPYSCVCHGWAYNLRSVKVVMAVHISF